MNSFAKVAFVALTAIGATFAAPAAAETPALFNTIEYRTNDLDALPKWKTAMHKVAKEQKAYAACAGAARSCSSKAVKAWQAMIHKNRSARQLDQLRTVNRFRQSVALSL